MIPPSRFITERDFAAHYAAAEFAAESGLACDTSVTLTWSLFGKVTDAEIQLAFTGYLKCLRDFCCQRRLPVVFFYAHEHSPKVGTHTHLALHIPPESRPRFREWMRFWARGFAKRHLGRRAPYAVRVRTRPQVEVWIHWLLFSYQVKGYEPSAVVQSAANAPRHQRPIYLGDLIAVSWKDPGPVTMKHRCGHSESLGPGRRALGCPVDDPVDRKAVLADLDIVAGHHRSPLQSRVPGRYGLRPFRSSYEDGFRDVRRLYPPEFQERITQIPAAMPTTTVEQENDIDAVMATLRL